MLSGYKTYIIGGALVFFGLARIWQGQADEGLKAIMEGLGLMTLRAGVAKAACQ